MTMNCRLIGALLVAGMSVAYADPAGLRTTSRADDPLVREIEAGYAKYVSAARKGDMATFRSLRTAARNAEIPPGATGKDLKGMAEMLAPGVEGYKFQRLDATEKTARLAYLRDDKQEMVVRVLMFEKDGSVWKAGDTLDDSHIGQKPKAAEAVSAALAKPQVQLR